MKSEHNILNQVSTISKIELSPTDKLALWSNIKKEIGQEPVRKKSFWQKKAVPVAALVGCLFIGAGTVALADGVNVLNVVVQFVHNITNGGSYGAGYGLEDTAVSLNLKTNVSATPANSTPGTMAQQSTSGAPPAHEVSTTQIMSDGSLFDTGYNTQLDNYLGTPHYPKLMGDNVAVNHIQAYSIDRSQGIFYMYVGGYVPGSNDQTINLDVYNKTGGSVVINGQTLANIKQQVNVSGIDATYVEFTNNKTFLNYLTWKSGDWIFVLRSNNVPESSLVQYAQNIENQAK